MKQLVEFKCLDCKEWNEVERELGDIAVWEFIKQGKSCHNCDGTSFDYHSTRSKQ